MVIFTYNRVRERCGTMKRFMSAVLAYCLLVGIVMAGSGRTAAAAAADPKIAEVGRNGSLLMEDGSLWIDSLGNRKLQHFPNMKAKALVEEERTGYALTSDGKILSWSSGQKPKVVKEDKSIRELKLGYWLRSDGTVRGFDKRADKLQNVVRFYNGEALVALTGNGELLVNLGGDEFQKIDTIESPSSVADIAMYGFDVVVHYKNGDVVLHSWFNVWDKSDPPQTIAQNVVHLSTNSNGHLFLTHRDGTVSYYRSGELNALKETKDFVKTVGVGYASFYGKKRDGSWVYYEEGKTKLVTVPKIASLSVKLSDPLPYVGDKVKVDIVANYSNNDKKTIPLKEADLVIEKPYIAERSSDGTLKVKAAGTTKITVKQGGVSKSVTLSASYGYYLQYAKQVNGVIYIPVKDVFETMGAKVSYNSGTKTFTAKLGNTVVELKQGSANAKVDGKAVRMKGTVRQENGMTVFPASLLADQFGAKLKWDAKRQVLTVSFGQGHIWIESVDTQAIDKRTALGGLNAYIGKTYYVNHYQGWKRFMKVKLVDIEVEDRMYKPVFQTDGGKQYAGYSTTADRLKELLADAYTFLNYDPYKKYKWPSSVWKLIEAEKIAIGMTKQQVLLSWGEPTSTSTVSGSGITVETWGYGYYTFVTFTNGKVSSIVR